MPDQSFTAAVLLGASSFPLHGETYTPNGAFLRSKQDFRAYLQDKDHGLGLPDEAICDLFDHQHLPSQQLVAIGRFLEKITKTVDRGTVCNLIVYYVGHGYFAGLRQEYHVALACLEMGYDATTGLKVNELAEVLKERARTFRRFVILDCCFAAEALKEFQGAAEDAIYAKATGAFAEDTPRRPLAVPRRGTALYCAAGKDHVARSPKDLPRTMFSDALLDVLRRGDPQYAPYLTLAEVKDLAWERLQDYPNPVRPVLHSPDQTDGDIAAIVGLFPNRGLRQVVDPKHETVELPAPAGPPAGHPVGQEQRVDPVRTLVPTGTPAQSLDEHMVAQVIHALTRLVGPIAPILVKKVRQQGSDFDALCRLIAERLDSKERQEFLAAVAEIRKRHAP
jgi:Caspase domain